MTETEQNLSQMLTPFMQTLSTEEQEFVATHNLLGKHDWPACVPQGLVPQAIAYYIQQKTSRYIHGLLHGSKPLSLEVMQPEKKKKSVRLIRKENPGFNPARRAS